MVIEDLINTSMSNAPGWGKGFLSLIRVQLNNYVWNCGIIYVTM